MKTPDPRGFPRQSAIAAFSENAPKINHEHWSFDPSRANHKGTPSRRRRLERIRTNAIELGMSNTVACLDNPLRGSLRSDTERANRIAILNNL